LKQAGCTRVLSREFANTSGNHHRLLMASATGSGNPFQPFLDVPLKTLVHGLHFRLPINAVSSMLNRRTQGRKDIPFGSCSLLRSGDLCGLAPLRSASSSVIG
jgi:hypothetical protein